jgi:hypothetical protein
MEIGVMEDERPIFNFGETEKERLLEGCTDCMAIGSLKL